MAFKSDAQRKHFFANSGGAGSAMVSFPDFSAAFADMDRQASYESEQAFHGPATGGANVDGPAAGGRNPMPTMSAEESAVWRKGTGAV